MNKILLIKSQPRTGHKRANRTRNTSSRSTKPRTKQQPTNAHQTFYLRRTAQKGTHTPQQAGRQASTDRPATPRSDCFFDPAGIFLHTAPQNFRCRRGSAVLVLKVIPVNVFPPTHTHTARERGSSAHREFFESKGVFLAEPVGVRNPQLYADSR